MVLVQADIEKERRIMAPDDVAAGLLDDVRQVFAGLPASHADGEILRAAQIGAPGFEEMVRRMPRVAEIEIFRRLGQGIAVKDDLGLAAVARRAADQLVLATLAIPPEVSERPVRLRHARIVFLDAPAHLGDQRLLQRLRRRENRLGMAVLRLQVRPYAGIEQRRVAQHLLPVVVLQPGIVVREGDTMECALERTSGRDGWLLDRTLRRNCRAPCRWAFQSPCRVPSRRRPARAWPQPSSAWCAAACAFPRPWCPTSRRGCGR